MPVVEDARDFYTTLGATTELMAASIYHRQRNLKAYFYWQIVPAIRYGQLKIFFPLTGSHQLHRLVSIVL